jgi:hypothetical protein
MSIQWTLRRVAAGGAEPDETGAIRLQPQYSSWLCRSRLMGATAASTSHPSTLLRPGSATTASAAATVYRRREPTATALYPIVQHHLESFLARASSADPFADAVPGWVEHDFRAYLRCGILAHGFARARCTDCGAERLVAAHTAHPERFVRGAPRPPDLPTAAWINRPPTKE